jgi:energy-coupling factor transport system ATP-binding protein
MTDVVFDHVRFAYPDGDVVLDGIDVAIDAGELVLLAGTSGSGKSTLLRTANGLVPHSTGGRFAGAVRVGDRSTRDNAPRDLADEVGFVHQDPEAHFVVDRVEGDVAFVLENLGTDPAAMRRRVEEVLDALAIAHLRDRSATTLSGGERQRVAIAGALAAGPSVLLLDEPTSELDPQGAEDVLAAVARLNDDLGTTVLLVEHRLERAASLCHRAILLDRGMVASSGEPHEVLADYAGAPVVTQLGRLLDWSPLPLTVREARALARRTDVTTRAGRATPPTPALTPVNGATTRPATGEVLVAGRDLRLAHGRRPVLDHVDVEVRQGEVVALLGRNGSGKTTLLRALGHLHDPERGEISRAGSVAYVPQDPNTLLFATTVRDELAQTLRLRHLADDGRVDSWLARFELAAVDDRHPRSLSSGQRQRVAIAAVAIGGADVLLLDEPTRGMDASSRHALEGAIDEHAREGGAVVLATHDVELAARSATSVVVLGGGEVVAAGDAHQVLSGSLFAPQVLRVVPPYLTVDEVAAAVEAS